MADRATLRSVLDDRRLSWSVDPLPSCSQPDDDLSYLVELDPIVTDDQLRRLDGSQFEQMMRELHAALKDAVPVQDTPQAALHREQPASVVVSLAPRPLVAPPCDLRESIGRLPASQAPITTSVVERRDPPPSVALHDPEAELLPELKLTVPAPDSDGHPRRPRLRIGRLVAGLAAASVLMLVPLSLEQAATRLAAEIGRLWQMTGARDAQALSEAGSVSPPSSAESSAERGNAQPASAESFLKPGLRPAESGLLDPKDIDALIAQGDRFLIARDISSARSYYERAIAAGSGPAAFALARTFDPDFLSQIGAKGVRPDPERAAAWYRVAADSAMRHAGVNSPAPSAPTLNSDGQR